jgi:hypothetical protein
VCDLRSYPPRAQNRKGRAPRIADEGGSFVRGEIESIGEQFGYLAGGATLACFDLADGVGGAGEAVGKLLLRQVERLAPLSQPLAERACLAHFYFLVGSHQVKEGQGAKCWQVSCQRHAGCRYCSRLLQHSYSGVSACRTFVGDAVLSSLAIGQITFQA